MAIEDEGGAVAGESAGEAAEIASLLGSEVGEGGGDGGAEAEPPKAAPKEEPKPKPKDDGERVTWKELRDQRKKLDARQRDLDERERGLVSKADKVALLDRLTSGEGSLEALGELGVSLDDLIEAQIAQQRGEKPAPKKKAGEESPEAKRIRELEERLAAREASETQSRAEAAFDEVASADPVLGRVPRARRVELGHALASEYHAAGKPVPHPSKIPALLVERLRAEYTELREIFEEREASNDSRAPSGAKTVSRQDSKGRGGPVRPGIRTDDDELREITELFRR